MRNKTKWPDSRQTKSGHTSTFLSADDTDFARARKAFSYRPLNRDSLPSAAKYLSERGLLTKAPRGEWAAITCPSHKGGAEKTPSLSVSLVDGHFRCFACGASGGDIVALHRLITGQKFVDAVRDLGGRFE